MIDWIRAKAPSVSRVSLSVERPKTLGKEGASDDDYRM
jgi:hypothetical protein